MARFIRLRKVEDTTFVVLQHLVEALAGEKAHPCQELVENTAGAEQVHLAGVLIVHAAGQDLRSDEARSPALGEQETLVRLVRCEAEIDEHEGTEVIFPRKHEVIRLHITVNDPEVMQHGQVCEELLHELLDGQDGEAALGGGLT